MPGNSVIGALRVDLGLNTAQFTAGMKKAQTDLAGFGKAATVGLAAVATAAIAAGAALGVAVKGAIDHADALNKSAQKAGLTVEALSRLEFAAKLSDMSLEGLTGGLEKLSKSMAAVSAGTGPVAAFKALGIEVKNADGTLRDSGAVFADIADRFSRLEDGAAKTALAIQIFGKSGAEMIPLLNAGRDGLKSMADESDRLGQTISTKTAQGAEKFNDTLTRIGAEIGGIVNIIAADLLPVLQQIADWFISPEVVGAIDGFFKDMASSFQQLVDAANQLIAAIKGIGDAANAVGDFLNPNGGKSGVANYSGADYNNAMTMAGVGLKIGNTASASDLYKGFGFGANGQMNLAGAGGSAKPSISMPTFDATAAKSSLNVFDIAVVDTTKKINDLIKSVGSGLTSAVQGFVDAVMSGTDPLKAFADQLANIGQQLLNAGIQSIIGSIFKTPLSFVPGTGFSQILGRASGGPVSVGTPYIVGENGPELMVPGASGTIVPNGGGMGGQSVVRVELGPELVGQVLEQAKNQSVQIVRSQAPAAVARSQGDHRRG